METPTFPEPVPLHAAIAALALVCVMGWGLWQVGVALSRPEIREVPATPADFLEGRTATAMEREIERQLPWRDELVTTSSALRYLLTRGAGDQVRLGREGWLFLADELRFHPEATQSMVSRLAVLEETRRTLERRGVLLMVALVPDKARVYAGHLPRGELPSYNAARYTFALEGLRAHAVPVVDLLTPLAAAARESDVYYHTDTHWNQRGAQIAARAIAEAVQARGIRLPPARFRDTVTNERECVGDLIRLMGLEHAPRALRPAADRESPVTTEQVPDDAIRGGGLFGEISFPVVLVGTSYSMRANFHGFLQQALGARVLNAARDDAGFGQSADEYLRNEAFRDAPPRVLVWEIPERFISAGPPSDDTPARPRG